MNSLVRERRDCQGRLQTVGRLCLRHGAGEPAAIAALVRDVSPRYRVDRARLYVAGMSASGAMTATLALCWASRLVVCLTEQDLLL